MLSSQSTPWVTDGTSTTNPDPRAVVLRTPMGRINATDGNADSARSSGVVGDRWSGCERNIVSPWRRVECWCIAGYLCCRDGMKAEVDMMNVYWTRDNANRRTLGNVTCRWICGIMSCWLFLASLFVSQVHGWKLFAVYFFLMLWPSRQKGSAGSYLSLS